MKMTTPNEVAGTRQVSEKHRFDEAKLADYLQGTLDSFVGPLTVRQFENGQSNPTYFLDTPTQRYVLRRKPPGKLLPSAHAVDREYRVMKAIHGTGFPVPEPHLYCDDIEIVGTPFYVMSYMEGRVFWDARLPELAPAERAAAFDSLNEVLAQLHTIDFEALGLADFGRPGNYFARQISRWTKQYKASETEAIEAMDRLIEWLPGSIPQDDSVSIVHGDCGLHNMMFHLTEPRIVAVLDWELSTLGHPLGDLTYSAMAWYGPSIRNVLASFSDLELGDYGIPTFDQYIARYCERTGRTPIENIGFYKSYNLFRMAAIVQGIVGRVRDGTASNPKAAAMAAYVRPLAEAAWQEALGAGA